MLCDAGLSASAANLAMLSAHKSGRGTVGFFKADEADEAQALVSALEDTTGPTVPVEVVASHHPIEQGRLPPSPSQPSPSRPSPPTPQRAPPSPLATASASSTALMIVEHAGSESPSAVRRRARGERRTSSEAAKTAVRGVRQRAMKTAKANGSKEEVKRAEKQVEELTTSAIATVDEAMKAKEKEVLTV